MCCALWCTEMLFSCPLARGSAIFLPLALASTIVLPSYGGGAMFLPVGAGEHEFHALWRWVGAMLLPFAAGEDNFHALWRGGEGAQFFCPLALANTLF